MSMCSCSSTSMRANMYSTLLQSPGCKSMLCFQEMLKAFIRLRKVLNKAITAYFEEKYKENISNMCHIFSLFVSQMSENLEIYNIRALIQKPIEDTNSFLWLFISITFTHKRRFTLMDEKNWYIFFYVYFHIGSEYQKCLGNWLKASYWPRSRPAKTEFLYWGFGYGRF